MSSPAKKSRLEYTVGSIILPVLETPRLILPPLAPRHLHRLTEVAGERAIADTTISVPHPLSEAAAHAWLDNAITESHTGRGAHYAVEIKPENHELVGYVGLKGIDYEHGEAELSFWLDRLQHGKGYVTEAAACLVSFGFQSLQLNRICAYHMSRNPASGKVLTKLGFQQEGRLRQRVRKWSVYEDVMIWSRLATDETIPPISY